MAGTVKNALATSRPKAFCLSDWDEGFTLADMKKFSKDGHCGPLTNVS